MGKHLTKTGIAGYGLLLAAASISVCDSITDCHRCFDLIPDE